MDAVQQHPLGQIDAVQHLGLEHRRQHLGLQPDLPARPEQVEMQRSGGGARLVAGPARHGTLDLPGHQLDAALGRDGDPSRMAQRPPHLHPRHSDLRRHPALLLR